MAQNIGVINTLIAEFKQRMQGSIYTAHSTVVPTEARSLHPWMQCPDFFCQPHWIRSPVTGLKLVQVVQLLIPMMSMQTSPEFGFMLSPERAFIPVVLEMGRA